MTPNKLVLFAMPLIAFAAPSAFAQLEVGGGLLDNCPQIEALRKAGDNAGARDKAQLCIQGLEQQLQSDVGKLFPGEVAGWKRTNIEQSNALGFTNVSATYSKAAADKSQQTATVSLTGGTGGTGLGGLLGGIAKLGAQAGQQVRVAGLPASVQADGTISVTLEGGSLLNFASSSFHDQASSLAGLGPFVNAFPVAAINKMLH